MKLKRYKYTRKDRSAPIFIKHAKFEKHILFLRLYCGRPKEDPCTLHKSRVYREPIPHGHALRVRQLTGDTPSSIKARCVNHAQLYYFEALYDTSSRSPTTASKSSSGYRELKMS